MLRLRLVEGLTLDEVGERTGVTGGRVQQLLRDYFGLRVRKPEGVVPAGESGVRVPPGFVEVLREIVECGYGAGIVTALREWQNLERQIARWSGDPKQNHVARRNIRRIQAFMLSAGVDDRSVVSVALPSEAVALVRFGFARGAWRRGRGDQRGDRPGGLRRGRRVVCRVAGAPGRRARAAQRDRLGERRGAAAGDGLPRRSPRRAGARHAQQPRRREDTSRCTLTRRRRSARRPRRIARCWRSCSRRSAARRGGRATPGARDPSATSASVRPAPEFFRRGLCSDRSTSQN